MKRAGISKMQFRDLVCWFVVALASGAFVRAQSVDPEATIADSASSSKAVGHGYDAAQHEAAYASLPQLNSVARVRAAEAYSKLPLRFEANQGQADSCVRFLAQGAGYTLFLTSNEAVLTFAGPSHTRKSSADHENPFIMAMRLVGANPARAISGLEELEGKSNYFIGVDPAKAGPIAIPANELPWVSSRQTVTEILPDLTQSNNGTIVTVVTETGTYTVNSDCSGSATLTLNKGDTATRHFNFQILHNSEEFLAIVTDAGRIETIDFKQQN